ncbi:hypothetical protein F5Y19DRAFT_474733 [Xylariaceae sp. FL1651]|nr:hypothetical protein F5Y19DRAFT_474733 [Xylariaceae sp. FL1651]
MKTTTCWLALSAAIGTSEAAFMKRSSTGTDGCKAFPGMASSKSTALGQAFRIFNGQAFPVPGNGTRNAKPKGGSNAINPSWRQTYVHVKPLRELAPNMGAYLNESDPGELDWTKSFWGDNYERLLQIKRAVDPDRVFWCDPYVGNDCWETRGNQLGPVNMN